MTVRQKQWQLYFLGYLDSRKDIDGIWGEKSERATLAFQSDCFSTERDRDGNFGPRTEELSRQIIRAVQNTVGIAMGISLAYDGLAGPETVKAVRDYQSAAGLPVTEIADEQTRLRIRFQPEEQAPHEKTVSGIFWERIEFFTEEEFRCKCGGRYCSGYPARMQEQVVRICDDARRHFGKPGYIVSGLRCRRWNELQGGTANSQHMFGEAVDLRIEGVNADQLLAFIRTRPHRYSYKINGTNVHVDIPKGKR